MSSTTIHHMAYKMSVNNARFNAGMTASRGEVRQADKIMREIRGPVDKLQEELVDLHKLYGKGLITLDAYTRKKRDLAKAMRKAGGAGAKFRSFLSKNKLKVAAVTSSLVVMIATIEKMRRTVNDQFPVLDSLAKKSDEIGIDPAMLEKLRAVTELSSTMNADQFDTALRKMTVRVSQAAAGMGEARDSLSELNLEAEYLNGLSPDKQYLAIADAIKNVNNEGDQARLIMKIFDDEAISLVNTLRMGSEEIMAQSSHIEGHSRASLAMIESSNDAWTKLGQTAAGFFQDMAIEFAPQVELLGDKLAQLLRDDAFRSVMESGFEMAKLVFPIFEAGLNSILWLSNDVMAKWLRGRQMWAELKGDIRASDDLGNQAAAMERAATKYRNQLGTDWNQYDKRVDSIKSAAEKRAEEIALRQARASEATAAASEATAMAVNDMAKRQQSTANAGSF